MERLWSPWRMEYIESAKDTVPEGCVFCEVLQESGDPSERRVLYRDDLAWCTLAKFPYNPGHLLVLPVRHTAELEELTAEETASVSALLQRSVRALREQAQPHGFNIGLNLGRIAGAGIPEHLHWHVVPRWSGDTNFMPVVGQTRVLPQLLQETFEKLAPRFAD
ncbi:MAG TPA: HIT domain-containing protein [Actinomycetota bacterium]|nr:HIT domain-containing protein [Actinomycetota bacterium]